MIKLIIGNSHMVQDLAILHQKNKNLQISNINTLHTQNNKEILLVYI